MNGRSRRNLVVRARSGEGPQTILSRPFAAVVAKASFGVSR
jgi:hypothetical protein